MAGSLTNYGETRVLDALFGGVALIVPGTWYIGLFTASPGEAGSQANEAPNYTRQAITNGTTNFPASTAGDPSTKASGPQITFGAAVTGAGTGVVTHAAYLDAPVGGNMWAYFDLATPKTWGNGDVPFIPAGGLTFTED